MCDRVVPFPNSARGGDAGAAYTEKLRDINTQLILIAREFGLDIKDVVADLTFIAVAYRIGELCEGASPLE